MLLALFRLFSRKTDRRRQENEKLLKLLSTFRRKKDFNEQKRADKCHVYKKCPSCKAVLRLPKRAGSSQNRLPALRQGIHGEGAEIEKFFPSALPRRTVPAAAAVVAAYIFLPFGCPIKYFLHINCPACGSTRALVALLKGDTASYFFYNPIALPLLLIVLFALHKELFGLSRRTESLILIPSAAVVIVVYIFRLIFMQ